MASTASHKEMGRTLPLTATEAAEIAARHGLGLQDAAGLLSLADNATDAERIAARFAAVPRAQSREDTTS